MAGCTGCGTHPAAAAASRLARSVATDGTSSATPDLRTGGDAEAEAEADGALLFESVVTVAASVEEKEVAALAVGCCEEDGASAPAGVPVLLLDCGGADACCCDDRRFESRDRGLALPPPLPCAGGVLASEPFDGGDVALANAVD